MPVTNRSSLPRSTSPLKSVTARHPPIHRGAQRHRHHQLPLRRRGGRPHHEGGGRHRRSWLGIPPAALGRQINSTGYGSHLQRIERAIMQERRNYKVTAVEILDSGTLIRNRGRRVDGWDVAPSERALRTGNTRSIVCSVAPNRDWILEDLAAERHRPPSTRSCTAVARRAWSQCSAIALPPQ